MKMKELKSIIYVIVAMFLGIFINLLSLTLVLKNIVQDEIVTNVIKESIAEQYIVKNINKLSEEEQKNIKELLDDQSSNEVVNILINNYLNYQSDASYKISEKDVETLRKYIISHQDTIQQFSSETINIDDITREITVDNIDKETRKAIGEAKADSNDIVGIINTYTSFASESVKLILALLVILSVGLLMLISWSVVKWTKATGICLITNGILITLLYLIIASIKDLILKYADLGIFIQNISFNAILIIGLVELILGIGLVTAHKILSKKELEVTKNKVESNKNEVEIPNNYS